MSDFLITELVWHPWLAWALAVLLAFTLGFWLMLGVTGVKVFLVWADYRREIWRTKAARVAWARGHLYEDDPPEYQHPDEEPDGQIWCDVCKAERPQDCICGEDADDDWLEKLRGIAGALRKMDGDDQLPDGPPRCNNRDCYGYGSVHSGACDVAPTMPAKCYTDPDGPAGPPVPWSSMERSMPLLPAIKSDLAAAGFGAHDYTEEVAESAFTKAQAMEVTERLLGQETEK